MNVVVLYDDARARRFEPFALTRPVAELRAGAELIRRRWAMALGAEVAGTIGSPHLQAFDELDAPRLSGDGRIEAGTVVANSRFAVAVAPAEVDADVWMCGDRVAAVRVEKALPPGGGGLAAGDFPLQQLASGSARVAQIGGWWLEEVWDLVRFLPDMLSDDIPLLAERLQVGRAAGLSVVGGHPVYIESGATIEPYVVFDVTAGPILVRRGSSIAAFTRLVGPTVVGEGTIIGGGRIATCSIGEHCRVHGELSNTIFVGHANKAHDGFVGHSYLGRWVNLGAGTVTSNLKNTYGPVALWTPDGIRGTGMQFLGTLFGDHAKTAIGTRLTTGSVIGAGANVFGAPSAPKVVPPFSWGVGAERDTYAIDRFLGVAERVMARRHVTLGQGLRGALAAAYEARWTDEG